MAVGAAAGAVLFKLGHTTIAIVAWSITGLLGAVSLASASARDALSRALAWFGRAVGSVVGTVLLTLVFVLGIVPVRFVKWLSGADDLKLERDDSPSHYEPCDAAERKRRYAYTMFATEVRKQRRGRLLGGLVVAALLLGLAELILRAQGFGPEAIVYSLDPRPGYFPAPNQNHQRYGGRVIVNNFGMRAPDFSEQKPEGAFRIMMIGDSTLWGGSYVDQDELYARIVDRNLNALNVGKVEVLNIGANGWGPFHERGYVDLHGQLGADLVIICMIHDDIDRDKYSLMSLPFFREGKPPHLALEEVAMHAMWRFRRERVGVTVEWLEQQRLIGIHEYDRLVRYLQTGDAGGTVLDPPPRTPVGGAEVMIAVQPYPDPGFGGEMDPVEAATVATLKKMFEPRGVAVHHPVGLFKGKGTREEIYHDDPHFNPKGHAIYAEFMTDAIKQSSRFRQFAARQHATARP